MAEGQEALWRQLLADITGETLQYREGGDVGPALGAARLAMLNCHPNVAFGDLLPEPSIQATYVPNQSVSAQYQEKYQNSKLYHAVKGLY